MDEASGEIVGYRTMDEDTPVVFSIPNNVDGGTSPGHCTIRLAEVCYKMHNDIVKTYGETIQRDNEYHPSKNMSTPFIDYREPYVTLRARVIDFTEEEDLLPLVLMYGEQKVGYSEGGSLTYDLDKIEQTLTGNLLKDMTPIKIMIRQFDFNGELRKGDNPLAKLPTVVEQYDLPDELRDQLTDEIDRESNPRTLLNFVEQVIEFVVTVAHHQVGTDAKGEGLSPQMTLKFYATDPEGHMHEDEDMFERISTPLLSSLVKMCHLNSLFRLLEDNTAGSFEERVLQQFKWELSTEQKAHLLRAQPGLQMDLLLPALRGYIVDLLCNESGNQNPQWNLKSEALAMVEAGELYLDEYAWFQGDEDDEESGFPNNLVVANALEVYQFFANQA